MTQGFQDVHRPVFIVGCGRSGTTILGASLSRHPQITYLNEPRNLWFTAYPETDIWTKKAAERCGRLVLTEADVDQGKSQILRQLFHAETVRTGRPVLVEKLPINNFRLPFIYKIFPDALFVHILRNGREVARSIAQRSEAGRWFGANEYKWNQLSCYAATRSDTSALPDICTNYYEQGLLEWRLSVGAVREFFRQIPERSCHELTYDEFVDSPVAAINGVLSFIGLDESPEVSDFVERNVVRKTDRLGLNDLSEKELRIGGDLLRSMR